MIRAGQPQRFISAHALVADENILHGFVKGMAHVELAGDVGWWNNYAVRGLIGVWLRVEITLCLPICVDPVLNNGRIIGFRHFINAVRAFFAHGKVPPKNIAPLITKGRGVHLAVPPLLSLIHLCALMTSHLP